MTREERPQARGPTKLELTQFEGFFRAQYAPLVKNLIIMGATMAEAEDAAQAAFEDIMRRWEHISNPNAYIRPAAVHHFVKTRTRLRKGLGRSIAALDTPSGVDTAADRNLGAWEGEQWVEQLLDSLTPTQRKVIALVIDGYSTKEIAVILGKGGPNIRQQLSLARERLRKVIEPHLEEIGRGRG